MARPVEFDRDVVLQKAMQAFWEKGYNTTSVAALAEKTRLNPGASTMLFSPRKRYSWKPSTIMEKAE